MVRAAWDLSACDVAHGHAYAAQNGVLIALVAIVLIRYVTRADEVL